METNTLDRHPWNSEIEVCQFIGVLAAMTKAKNILEIGVFEGETAKEILQRKDKNSYYIGIDIVDYRKDDVKELFEKNKGEFILGKSIDVLTTFQDKTFDLIFVDGDHSWENVLPEFKQVKRVLATNGLIVYHDSLHMDAPNKITSYAKYYGYNVIYLKTPEMRGLSLISKL